MVSRPHVTGIDLVTCWFRYRMICHEMLKHFKIQKSRAVQVYEWKTPLYSTNEL